MGGTFVAHFDIPFFTFVLNNTTFNVTLNVYFVTIAPLRLLLVGFAMGFATFRGLTVDSHYKGFTIVRGCGRVYIRGETSSLYGGGFYNFKCGLLGTYPSFDINFDVGHANEIIWGGSFQFLWRNADGTGALLLST